MDVIEDLFYSAVVVPLSTGTNFISYLLIGAVGIVALVALAFVLWHIKGIQEDREFIVTMENLGSQSEKIRDLLSKMKVTEREKTYAILLLEEVFVRLQDIATDSVTAKIRRVFGEVSIMISASGEAFNPFASLESWDTESEDYLRDLIFRAHKADLSYSRRNGKNTVSLRVHRSGENRSLYVTFAAIFLGMATGFCMKWLPEGLTFFLSEIVLSTVQTLFLNALSLMLAPVVFFSVATSLSNLSGGSEIGRIGGKVLSSYLTTTVLAILIGFGVNSIFFGGGVPPLPKNLSPLPAGMQQSKDVSLSTLILNMVPHDMVSPILAGNMLQIIFVALLSGLSLSALGEKTAGIRSFFHEANTMFLKMMEMIITFMPLVAFASMSLLVYASSMSTLKLLFVYLISIVVGGLALIVLYTAMILFLGRLSPLSYIRKIAVYLLTPFMIPSSSACIPLTIDFTRKKLGVSNKIASFSIPLGATINMNGTGMSVIITTLMLTRMCGVELDSGLCLKLGVMALLLSVGAPGVPNSGLVVVATLLAAANVPVSALGFVVGVWNIVDRLGTACNVNGDIATSLIVAKTEGELDMKTYAS